MTHKECPNCKRYLHVHHFAENKQRTDKLQKDCKQCTPYLRKRNKLRLKAQNTKIRNSQNAFKQEHAKLLRFIQNSKARAKKLKCYHKDYKIIHLIDLIESQNDKCFWCNTNLGNDHCFDHVIPLARKGFDTLSNIVASCNECNFKKKDLMPWDYDANRFVQHLRRVA